MKAWARLAGLIFVTDVALSLAVRAMFDALPDPAPAGPLLGLATTGELLEELAARIEVNGPGLGYRTTDQ